MLLQIDELHTLGNKIFENLGIDSRTRNSIVHALVLAELEGIPSHGFSRIPYYAAQVLSGKIRKNAQCTINSPSHSVVIVNANHGFAFPALEKGLFGALMQAARMGVSLFTVQHSHHCGVLGLYAERAAEDGMIALLFSNTPAAVAPWSSREALFGTNPLAFGCPRRNADPLVIDMSLSMAARGRILLAKQKGEKIPAGWARDKNGQPTSDPAEALQGTLLPFGGYKGSALGLIVEILTAALSASSYSFQASSFFTAQGPAPDVSQTGIIINPKMINPCFSEHLEELVAKILLQKTIRLPGARRIHLKNENIRKGVILNDNLYDKLMLLSKTHNLQEQEDLSEKLCS